MWRVHLELCRLNWRKERRSLTSAPLRRFGYAEGWRSRFVCNFSEKIERRSGIYFRSQNSLCFEKDVSSRLFCAEVEIQGKKTLPNLMNLNEIHRAILWICAGSTYHRFKEQEFTLISQIIRKSATPSSPCLLFIKSFRESQKAIIAHRFVADDARFWVVYEKKFVQHSEDAWQCRLRVQYLESQSHDPFEVVSISTLNQYVMYLTLHINKHHVCVLSCTINQRSNIFGLFASMPFIILREFLCCLMSMQSLTGMILKLVQDDRTFLTNFINIVDLKDQKLTIRSVFKIVEMWKSGRATKGGLSGLVGK